MQSVVVFTLPDIVFTTAKTPVQTRRKKQRNLVNGTQWKITTQNIARVSLVQLQDLKKKKNAKCKKMSVNEFILYKQQPMKSIK